MSNVALIRGLDMPELEYVFIYHDTKGKGMKRDDYLHVAGRVGRFGRRGRVVTVIPDEKGRGGKKGEGLGKGKRKGKGKREERGKGEAREREMGRMLEGLGVRAVRLVVWGEG